MLILNLMTLQLAWALSERWCGHFGSHQESYAGMPANQRPVKNAE